MWLKYKYIISKIKTNAFKLLSKWTLPKSGLSGTLSDKESSTLE